jgi:hypothetical protein
MLLRPVAPTDHGATSPTHLPSVAAPHRSSHPRAGRVGPTGHHVHDQCASHHRGHRRVTADHPPPRTTGSRQRRAALEQAHPEDDQPYLHHAAGPHGPNQRTRQPNTTACRRRRSGRLAADRRWNGRAAPPQKPASREQTAEVGPGGHSRRTLQSSSRSRTSAVLTGATSGGAEVGDRNAFARPARC